MTEVEKELAKEVLKLLKAANIKIRGYEAYDNDENYVGTRYYLARPGYPGEVAVSVERLFDAQNLVREV